MTLRLLPMLLLAPMLSGCIASAIVGAGVAVVKAPFQLAGAAIDGLTTSQEEADRNRGKAIRKQQEADAKAAKKAAKAAKRDSRDED